MATRPKAARTHLALLALIPMASFGALTGLSATARPAPNHAPQQRPLTSYCPPAKALKPLLRLGNVYLGTIHGTNQTPALVECLVRAALASGVKHVTVSVELPPEAADLSNPVWSLPDGRASKAMHRLVRDMEAREHGGRVTLDFQLHHTFHNSQQKDDEIGHHLRALAARGERIIAVGGDLHSQRWQALIPSLHIKPAGSMIGPDFKTVFINPVGPGAAWNCQQTCGPHATGSFIKHGKVGQLLPGKRVGHDYIYEAPRFTASPPARAARSGQ